MKSLKYYEQNRHATWLELFFDLIFVVTIGKVTHTLGHLHQGHFEPEQIWSFLLLFVPLWWIWSSHTIYSNRFDTDSNLHRLSTLFIMLLLIVLSARIGEELEVYYPLVIVCYVGIRAIISIMYISTINTVDGRSEYASRLGFALLVSSAISLSSLIFDPPIRYIVAYIGIFLDILLPVFPWSKLKPLPAHTDHLVERLGLLTLILLGESVISLAGGLSDIQWNPYNVMAAITGFVMTCSIWWIYFDSFYLLSRNESSMSGHSLIYSHLFLFLGLALLANLIRHAILNDIAIHDFQIMSVIGMVLFFVGKQYGYFIAVPKIRKYILQNTLIVFSLGGSFIWLPRVEYILIGLTLTMISYVLLNFRYR
ncbi:MULTISPECIES: low temperature requirement protein A [Pseudomonas]|jgi:low temperature requirement protein LtrA|uniref:Low temperature requirement protein A n=1 Tax=Pseudomonas graminis TaxID=158627 RepID=A0A1C2DHF4_9PSED|nr:MULTISPECIES: low temperature requirement protein A [Pseudomonas]MBD8706836.1 low temperature requirement protein A [Pseudomonas sp. CFBP 13711]MBD8713010.1 low temperature requirement protein A [Pseudomonas sp. CFBP 13715]OCX14189.1 low temperature requirement protein A [Pseudomonas graminis]RYF51972.1 MAG: low temperature requirement protein A [Cytophagaceae bacterium]